MLLVTSWRLQSCCTAASSTALTWSPSSSSPDIEPLDLDVSGRIETKYVIISPFPLATIRSGRCVSQDPFPAAVNASAVAWDTWILPTTPLLSIRDAVFTCWSRVRICNEEYKLNCCAIANSSQVEYTCSPSRQRAENELSVLSRHQR